VQGRGRSVLLLSEKREKKDKLSEIYEGRRISIMIR